MERFVTISELAQELHISDKAVRSRLRNLGLKAYGRRAKPVTVNGMRYVSHEAIYFLDPATVVTGRETMRGEGWLRTTDIAEMVGWPDGYKLREFLQENNVKNQKWNNAIIWMLPDDLRDPEVLKGKFMEWREAQRKPGRPTDHTSDDDPNWFADVEPGPIHDLVMEERRLKGMVGEAVTVESKESGERWEGVLLQYCMVCFRIRCNGKVREFLTRNAQVVVSS